MEAEMVDLTKLSVVPITVTEIIVIGVVATLTTDLWQRLLQAIGFPPANWGLVGRWVAGFLHGSFIHRSIACDSQGPWRDRNRLGIPLCCGNRLCRSLSRDHETCVWFWADPRLGAGICDGVAHSALVCHAAGARLRLNGGTYSQAHCGPRLQRVRA